MAHDTTRGSGTHALLAGLLALGTLSCGSGGGGGGSGSGGAGGASERTDAGGGATTDAGGGNATGGTSGGTVAGAGGSGGAPGGSGGTGGSAGTGGGGSGGAGGAAGVSCTLHADCDTGDTTGYVCLPVNGEQQCAPCDADARCARAEHYAGTERTSCVEGRCTNPCDVERGPGCACGPDRNCIPGLTCDGQFCIPDPCEADRTEGCECDAERPCAGDLTCPAGRCVPPAGPCDDRMALPAACACDAAAGDQCGPGLSCIELVCTPDMCRDLGTDGCPCREAAPACDDGFVCLVGNVCGACSGDAGCACGEGLAPCVDGLECDDTFHCAAPAGPAPGELGGECRPMDDAAGPCNRDLRCDAATGLCAACAANAIGCPCQAGACVNLVCDADTDLCRDSIACEEGDITCRAQHRDCTPATPTTDGVCSVCSPGYHAAGATCEPDVGTTCVDIEAACAALGQVCDEADGTPDCVCAANTHLVNGRCAPYATCGSLQCNAMLNRDCIDPPANTDAVCGACLPNFVDAGVNTPCDAKVACGLGGLDCAALNRVCASGGPNADDHCGGCQANFEFAVAGCQGDECTCVPVVDPQSCDDLPPGGGRTIRQVCADDQHKPCADAGGAGACTRACLPGFVYNVAGDSCTAKVTCISPALNCAGRHRDCVDGGVNADDTCGMCANGFIQDPANPANCVAPPSCNGVVCAGDTFCVITNNAAACVDRCPDPRDAYNPASRQCELCGDPAAVCGGPGASGFAPYRTARGRCICDSNDGYYALPDALGTQACDADGDGWTRAEAWTVASSNDQRVRDEARCRIRTANLVRFEPDGDDPFTATVPEISPADRWFPLLETARNDVQADLARAGNTVPALPGGRALQAREVNSTTKYCVTEGAADYNGNGFVDVLEDRLTNAGGLPGQVVLNQLSVFAELFTGHWEGGVVPPGLPNDNSPHGTWVITERARAANAGGLDLGFTYDDAAGTYWRQCRRDTDSTYVDAPLPGDTQRGVDLAGFGSDIAPNAPRLTRSIMGHHSEFKCIVTRPGADSVFDPDVAGGARKIEEPPYVESTNARRLFSLQQCTAQANGIAPVPPMLAENPSTVDFNCVALPAQVGGIDPVANGFVGFGIVRYQPYGGVGVKVCRNPNLPEGQQNDNALCAANETCTAGVCVPDSQRGGYQRGCVNECDALIDGHFDVGTAQAPGADMAYIGGACPQYTPGAGFGDRLACLGKLNDFGRLTCGCGLNYAGANCELSCTDADLTFSAGLDLTTRSGVWMCASIAGSEGDTMTGGNVVLEGNIPLSAVDRSVESVSAGCADNDNNTPCIRLQ